MPTIHVLRAILIPFTALMGERRSFEVERREISDRWVAGICMLLQGQAGEYV